MRVAILYYQLFDADGREQLIGGVETYLLNLGALCAEMGWEPTLFQCANHPFQRAIGDLKIIGVPASHLKHRQKAQALFHAATGRINLDKDILIFGSDQCSVPTDSRRCVAIQHGVSWDLPMEYVTQKRLCRSGWGAKLKKKLVIRTVIKNFENCRNRVCVDYNFLNWYRATVTTELNGRIWVIPNFAPWAAPDQVDARNEASGVIRILFARRFTQYRGTRMMAQATKDLLRSNTHVRFTFAGEGPDENWLRSCFGQEPRVTFMKFLPPDVLRVHLEHDIAVVPSVASEGTSFSVAEAMGAGCAVVASAVGGITNMIIDGYNGLLVMPGARSLATGLERVVEDSSLRRRLGRNAYETAKDAFSLERWKARWRGVLEDVANG